MDIYRKKQKKMIRENGKQIISETVNNLILVHNGMII